MNNVEINNELSVMAPSFEHRRIIN
jgi:hypothetical protein